LCVTQVARKDEPSGRSLDPGREAGARGMIVAACRCEAVRRTESGLQAHPLISTKSAEYRGQGIGETLLVDVPQKALRNSTHVVSWAIIVDANDEEAAESYERYGFISFPSIPNRLFLSMTSIQNMLR